MEIWLLYECYVVKNDAIHFPNAAKQIIIKPNNNPDCVFKSWLTVSIDNKEIGRVVVVCCRCIAVVA